MGQERSRDQEPTWVLPEAAVLEEVGSSSLCTVRGRSSCSFRPCPICSSMGHSGGRGPGCVLCCCLQPAVRRGRSYAPWGGRRYETHGVCEETRHANSTMLEARWQTRPGGIRWGEERSGVGDWRGHGERVLSFAGGAEQGG